MEVPRTTLEKSIIDRKMEIYNTEITDPILIEGFKKSKEFIKKLQEEEKEKERLSFYNFLCFISRLCRRITRKH